MSKQHNPIFFVGGAIIFLFVASSIPLSIAKPLQPDNIAIETKFVEQETVRIHAKNEHRNDNEDGEIFSHNNGIKTRSLFKIFDQINEELEETPLSADWAIMSSYYDPTPSPNIFSDHRVPINSPVQQDESSDDDGKPPSDSSLQPNQPSSLETNDTESDPVFEPTPIPMRTLEPTETTNTESDPVLESIPTSPSITVYHCDDPLHRVEIINNRIAAVSDETYLNDTSSPQYQALTWITNNDPAQLGACASNLLQRYALAVLYYAFNGDNWKNKNGWLVDPNECQWHGVTCNANVFEKSIVKIDLGNNGLSGVMPSEISQLTDLEELHFFSNSIQGTLPRSLGTFSKLSSIDLHDNMITGTILNEIYDIHALQYLHMSNNLIQGSISTKIGKLTNLIEFVAANNNIVGKIPTEFNNLASLEALILRSNEITGSFDFSNGATTSKLSWIDLSDNYITGKIPEDFYDLRSLQRVYLSSNRLSGTISTNIGLLTNLKQLWLDENKLSGTLSEQIGNLVDIEHLLLHQNMFAGTLPLTMGNLQNTKYLDLSSNLLSGSIPETFYSLSKLEIAYFSNNTFTGSLSPMIGGMNSLQILWLDGNKFFGTVPSVEVGNLQSLQQLLLNYNEFSGIMPESICNLQQTSALAVLGADCEYPPEVVCLCCTLCT